MKKILAFALILTLLFTMPLLYACDGGSTGAGNENPDENSGEIKDPSGDTYTPDENNPDQNKELEGPKTMTLKIGSFNIANGSYVKHNMQKLADDIMALNLDIVGLQEVDKLSGRSANLDTMKVLSELTGYEYYYFSKAIDLPSSVGGEYGTGILSKYPIVYEETTQLPSGGYEQRVLGNAIIEVEGVQINFYNAHLTYNTLEVRSGQFEEIDNIVSEYDYCIMTGDFNIEALSEFTKFTTMTGASNEENPLKSYWREETPPWPTECLDNVFYSKKFTLKNCGLYGTDRAQGERYSDHYLLWAELEFTLEE